MKPAGSSAAVAVAIATVLIAAPLAAATGLALVPAGNARVAYDFSTVTDSPRGTERVRAKIALSALRRGEVRVEIANDDGTSSDVDATYAKDGSIVPDGGTDFVPQSSDAVAGPTPPPAIHVALQRMNQLAEIAHSAPAAPNAGDTWPATVTIPLPRNETTSLRVQVRVMKVDGDALDIEANGTGKTTLSPPANAPSYQQVGALGDGPDAYQGAIPVTTTLKSDAHFERGILVSATGNLRSTLKLREEVEVTSDWTIDRE